MKRMMIIHGAFGYPQENWFLWLKYKVEQMGVVCDVPQFPTPEHQSLSNWLNLFEKKYYSKVDSETILIGHSLGAVFILRLLEEFDIRVKAVVLVGCFLGEVGVNQFDDLNHDFFATAFNWQLIRSNVDQIILFHGTDDPYVDTDTFNVLVQQLEALPVLVANAGHFNAESGYHSFPLLLKQLDRYICNHV